MPHQTPCFSIKLSSVVQKLLYCVSRQNHSMATWLLFGLAADVSSSKRQIYSLNKQGSQATPVKKKQKKLGQIIFNLNGINDMFPISVQKEWIYASDLQPQIIIRHYHLWIISTAVNSCWNCQAITLYLDLMSKTANCKTVITVYLRQWTCPKNSSTIQLFSYSVNNWSIWQEY